MMIMKRIFQITLVTIFSAGLLAACSGEQKADSAEAISVTMYKNEGCQCCTKWAEHLNENGYDVTEKPVDNLSAMKFSYDVPNDMSSCHTAIIDGYVVEGHVPAEDIDRLLEERPDAKGLALPGMPTGSPGMEVPGQEPQPYDVMIFQEDGSRDVYASH